MEKDTNIELRSEALRNVIGQVPPLRTSWNWGVSELIFV